MRKLLESVHAKPSDIGMEESFSTDSRKETMKTKKDPEEGLSSYYEELLDVLSKDIDEAVSSAFVRELGPDEAKTLIAFQIRDKIQDIISILDEKGHAAGRAFVEIIVDKLIKAAARGGLSLDDPRLDLDPEELSRIRQFLEKKDAPADAQPRKT